MSKIKSVRLFSGILIIICLVAVLTFVQLDFGAKKTKIPFTEMVNAKTVSLSNLTEAPEITDKNEEEAFLCPMMIFTQEEAEALLQRFEDERIAEQKAAEEAARIAAEAEKAAKAKAAAASRSLNSYYAGALSYTENDVFMLATIIGQETAGEDEEIALAVGNVVINRINDPRFPNNMYDVLTARLQYGHDNGEGFYFNSYVTAEGRELCLRVARRLLEGERVLPSNVVWQAGFPQGEGVYIYYDTYPYGTYLCY